ncbi:MAG: dockerin type I repeat-containing protein [Thermodesulfobacteriota bacterium]
MKTFQVSALLMATVLFFSLSFSAPVFAITPKPSGWVTDAKWSGQRWGVIEIMPAIVKKGSTLRVQGIVVGGPAAIPYWGCTEWGWSPNGTFGIGIYSRGINDLLVKEAGAPPPLGWENRISDTCYCYLSTWGASGGCSSKEVQPNFFIQRPAQAAPMETYYDLGHRISVSMNPRSNGWQLVGVEFSGTAGVGWSDTARDYVYLLGDLSELDEDSDQDGLPDVWEIAHDPALGNGDPLSKFSGGPVSTAKSVASRQSLAIPSNGSLIDPFAPREPNWVAKDENDWDGDGISNKDEYLNWYDNLLDSNGIPYDPTVINTGPRGDLNGDGKTNLADAILAMGALAGNGNDGSQSGLVAGFDIDGDNRTGLQEVSFILRSLL